MNDLIILQNNLSVIIRLLLSINEKFSVYNSKIEISKNELSDNFFQKYLDLTASYHIERLKISRDFLIKAHKIENFNLKVNYYDLKKLLYTANSMLKIVYKNSDSLHSSIGRINELNSELLKTAIYKEDRIICNTSANNSKEIIIEYDLLDLFKKMSN